MLFHCIQNSLKFSVGSENTYILANLMTLHNAGCSIQCVKVVNPLTVKCVPSNRFNLPVVSLLMNNPLLWPAAPFGWKIEIPMITCCLTFGYLFSRLNTFYMYLLLFWPPLLPQRIGSLDVWNNITCLTCFILCLSCSVLASLPVVVLLS